MSKILFFQVCRFGIVGLTAACIHFMTVILLVQNFMLPPLSANIFGFMFSFQISYWGHRLWTFSTTEVLHRVTFSRLLFLQIMNFCANELLFYIFLTLNLPYPLALIIVLAVLPIFTFFSSKVWIFKA